MWSTIATLSGELVVVGGRQSFLQVDSIYQLIDGEWVKIGSMSSGREGCLLVTTSPDKMMIVSGVGEGNSVLLRSVIYRIWYISLCGFWLHVLSELPYGLSIHGKILLGSLHRISIFTHKLQIRIQDTLN